MGKPTRYIGGTPEIYQRYTRGTPEKGAVTPLSTPYHPACNTLATRSTQAHSPGFARVLARCLNVPAITELAISRLGPSLHVVLRARVDQSFPREGRGLPP